MKNAAVDKIRVRFGEEEHGVGTRVAGRKGDI